MVLSLENRVALTKKRKRVGRGGSRGGKSGRGSDGQKARSGDRNVRQTFEGGQMPLVRRLPKRGFNNAAFRDETLVFNVGQLNEWFEDGQKIERQTFVERGLIGSLSKARIKILGDGELKKKLIVHADGFSKRASTEIVKQGGEVHTEER